MKKREIFGCLVILTAIFALGCSSNKYKEGERLAHQPIHCPTAEGDIRMLLSEKSHASDQAAAGASSVVPAAAVVGLVTGAEGENLKVATGEYNKMIDKRIAEIKRKCGLK